MRSPGWIVAGVWLLMVASSEACPSCKDNINTGNEALQAAYSITVLLLLALPFSMIGCFAFWLKRQGVFDAPPTPPPTSASPAHRP